MVGRAQAGLAVGRSDRPRDRVPGPPLPRPEGAGRIDRGPTRGAHHRPVLGLRSPPRGPAPNLLGAHHPNAIARRGREVTVRSLHLLRRGRAAGLARCPPTAAPVTGSRGGSPMSPPPR